MNKTERTEILVVGGGLAGLTMAIALAQAGRDVICLDRDDPGSQHKVDFDGRTTALSFATHNILTSIGVWPLIAADVEPIRDIRVTDGRAPLVLHFPFGAVNGAPFGWIIENRLLRRALARAAKALPHLRHRAPAQVTALEFGAEEAVATLQGGGRITAQLVVGADGKGSFCREAAGIAVREQPYGQIAIVCTLKHTEPHYGLALENFRPNGPFAVLPMTSSRVSIVWSEKATLAPHFLKLSDRDFLAELDLRIGGYLGNLKLASGRFSYPLESLHAARSTALRLALISEAAHRLHPIAGQGLNVGMRDIALLAELIVDAARQGADIGGPAVLQAYERGRRRDTRLMLAGTHLLTHLFSNDLPPLRFARRAGLLAVERTRPLKSFFMRYAMGTTGPRQRLTSGEKL